MIKLPPHPYNYTTNILNVVQSSLYKYKPYERYTFINVKQILLP